MSTVHESIPSPPISSFDIGPFTIHFYALCILTGILIAVALTQRRLSRQGAEKGIVLDVALWTVPLGIVGGRLYHVVTHPNDYFFPGADLWKVLFVWEGGLAIFGAIIAGSIGAYIACRRRGLRFWAFTDALVPGLLFAQAFGRFGNYFNHELYGGPTTLPWGLQIEATNAAFPPGLPPGTLFHPLFLYEMIWNIAGAFLIIYLERRLRLHSGRTVALYFIWYGIGRAFFESLRLDPTEFVFAGLKANVIAALLLAVVGVVLFTVQTRRHLPNPGSPYVSGRASKLSQLLSGNEANGDADLSIRELSGRPPERPGPQE
ncbi:MULTISPECIES: prolipoprotein diacylglyceryl transferase [Subtercola]|uniref:Phosphatidylglycerol--prolipoprotein diacylglyceryl transferase n=1 Tax=Subtercola vilae TaxID=2056433 RepID=A0A4T2C145_9MICO|nr:MULTISPECIES: prolipoprotein diacylglyceryl transferase [Subtercola]MEA9984223.1 prolipoprotein diacylglyceryl transferase [Subtercola sp. RTI3]TIH37399.1 prolipoprotein diacylglyceryl transferase [Subtercola vilae]